MALSIRCMEVGLSNAGDALNSALGGSAKTIWAVGLLAAGQVRGDREK